MTDFQSWIASITIISIVGMLVMHSTAKYAIMRATEKYVSPTPKERDM